jgi:hypothetical protein
MGDAAAGHAAAAGDAGGDPPPGAALPRQRGGAPRQGGAGSPWPGTVRLSPFTEVPRLIPALRRRPAAQVGVNLLVFTAVPTGLFWYWFLADVRPALGGDMASLRWAMPLAAVWITVGPLLMQIGEFIEERWLDLLRRSAALGWNLPAVRHQRETLGRFYYPATLTGALAATTSLALALPALREIIPIDGTWSHIAAFVVIAQVGFTSSSGVHGAVKAITVPGASLRGATLRWGPFRPAELGSIRASYRCYTVFGVLFSVGTVFVPALTFVEGSFSGGARFIVWMFIGALLVNGTAMFVVPSARLYIALRRAKDATLERLDHPVERLFNQVIRDGDEVRQEMFAVHRALTNLLALRRDIAAVPLVPSGRALLNVTLTVVIPITSLVLSIGEQIGWF